MAKFGSYKTISGECVESRYFIWRSEEKKKKEKQSCAICMLRLCGIWKIGKKNVRAWISLPCTRRDTQSAHTYTRTHRERDTHASAYTIACFVPRNFVRHARCRMLCALPVTRILNTKFNFFFFSLPSPPLEWSFAISALAKYAIIGSHLARDRISLDQFPR